MFLMLKWRAESSNSWAALEGEVDGSSLPPTLCLSHNLGMQQRHYGLLQALPGLRGRKPQCCLLQQPEAAAEALEVSLQVWLGRRKRKGVSCSNRHSGAGK